MPSFRPQEAVRRPQSCRHGFSPCYHRPGDDDGLSRAPLMRQVILPPKAPAMLASLRALGYSFEAALADIIDNSIAAGATRVDIQFRAAEPRSYVAIVDDGLGMAPDFLIEAMRHGGAGPLEERQARDLGR